jgi:hypothetical protein
MRLGVRECKPMHTLIVMVATKTRITGSSHLTKINAAITIPFQTCIHSDAVGSKNSSNQKVLSNIHSLQAYAHSTLRLVKRQNQP